MSDISDEMVDAWLMAHDGTTRARPGRRELVRAGLDAAYRLLRAQIAEEIAAEVLADAARHPINYCQWTTGEIVATIRDLAADGAGQMTVERAEARDEQED